MNRNDDLGTLIKAIENRKEMLEDRALRSYGISASKAHILLCLYDAEDHTLSLKQLEHQLELSQSTVVKLIHGLCDPMRLTEVIKDPFDQRIRKIKLTSQGIQLASQIKDIPMRMENTLKGSMNNEEYQFFKQQLISMKNRLEAADEKKVF